MKRTLRVLNREPGSHGMRHANAAQTREALSNQPGHEQPDLLFDGLDRRFDPSIQTGAARVGVRMLGAPRRKSSRPLIRLFAATVTITLATLCILGYYTNILAGAESLPGNLWQAITQQTEDIFTSLGPSSKITTGTESLSNISSAAESPSSQKASDLSQAYGLLELGDDPELTKQMNQSLIADIGRNDPFAPVLDTYLPSGTEPDHDVLDNVQFTGFIDDAQSKKKIAIIRVADPSGDTTLVKKMNDSFEIEGKKIVLKTVKENMLHVTVDGTVRTIPLNDFSVAANPASLPGGSAVSGTAGNASTSAGAGNVRSEAAVKSSQEGVNLSNPALTPNTGNRPILNLAE